MPKTPNLLEGETLDEFNALSESLYSELDPTNDIERRMVDMLVQHQWFMRRALRMQEHLSTISEDGKEPDAKRINLIVRYYKTHERAFAQAKRELERMRKHHRVMASLGEKQTAAVRSRERQWEQILKKMPPLTDWVN